MCEYLTSYISLENCKCKSMEHVSMLLPFYIHVHEVMLNAEQEFLFIHPATNKTSVDHCNGHGFWLHG